MDHMYSVDEAYRNNIDPKIVSHPANCRIMIHNENNSKDSKSSITIEKLKERIKLWQDNSIIKYNDAG